MTRLMLFVRFHMDPSGTYIRYEAKAIGSGSEGAQQALQEVFNKELSLEEASVQALTILRQVMEEKLDATNVEVGLHVYVVCSSHNNQLFFFYNFRI